jgi:hypothetical protein
MAAINEVRQYPAVDRYWALVKRTLCEVFKGNADLVDTLRKDMSQRPADEQLLFYHSEPLDVAADLVGEQPGDEQVKQDRRLADQCGWR